MSSQTLMHVDLQTDGLPVDQVSLTQTTSSLASELADYLSDDDFLQFGSLEENPPSVLSPLAEEWQVVAHRRSSSGRGRQRNRSPGDEGGLSHSSQGSRESARGMGDLKWVHLSGVSTATSTSGVCDFVKRKLGNTNVRCFSLMKNGVDLSTLRYCTFRVGVEERHFSRLLDRSFWPSGTRVREFMNRNENFRGRRAPPLIV